MPTDAESLDIAALRLDVDALKRPVDDLYAEAQAWPEAREIRNARDALGVFPRTTLVDALRAAFAREHYAVAASCPACGVTPATST